MLPEPPFLHLIKIIPTGAKAHTPSTSRLGHRTVRLWEEDGPGFPRAPSWPWAALTQALGRLTHPSSTGCLSAPAWFPQKLSLVRQNTRFPSAFISVGACLRAGHSVLGISC